MGIQSRGRRRRHDHRFGCEPATTSYVREARRGRREGLAAQAFQVYYYRGGFHAYGSEVHTLVCGEDEISDVAYYWEGGHHRCGT